VASLFHIIDFIPALVMHFSQQSTRRQLLLIRRQECRDKGRLEITPTATMQHLLIITIPVVTIIFGVSERADS